MIFPTGRHLWQDVVLATPLATLRQIQGEALHPHAMGDTALACFGQIPWIDSQGAWQARRWGATMSMTTATVTTMTPTTRMVVMAKTMMGKWNTMAVTMTMTTSTLMPSRMTTTIGRWWWDGDATPPIWGNKQLMSTVWGGVDKREGQFRGGGRQKRVEVEEIEWRSLHLHSINFKPTFRAPQCRERTGTYSVCVLGVRLHYWRHGDHVYWWWKRGLLGVCRSVFWEGGFGPRSFHLGFHSVLIKIHLSKLYTVRKILLSSFRVLSSFCCGFLFEEIFNFAKTTDISLKGG